MQFLKTLFWMALTIGAILFSAFNWSAVTINLWGGLQADVKLPVLVLAAFLLGFLPLFLYHRARVWSLNRQIHGFERQVALFQAPPLPPVAPSPTDPGYPGPATIAAEAPAPELPAAEVPAVEAPAQPADAEAGKSPPAPAEETPSTRLA